MYDEAIAELAKELNVSEGCANDVFYLRSRSRWSQKLEDELIELHRKGERPNMNDFGVTRETQDNLAEAVLASAIFTAKKYADAYGPDPREIGVQQMAEIICKIWRAGILNSQPGQNRFLVDEAVEATKDALSGESQAYIDGVVKHVVLGCEALLPDH